jgi:membrane protein implicated in regulation of membrane protease activity
MPEWMMQVSAFSIFLAIAAFGFLFLLISLVFSGLFEFFESEIEHDIGAGDHGGPGFFSVRVLSVFVTAFGATGAIATHYKYSVMAASGMGLLSGFLLASIVLAFARFLYGQQSSSEVRTADVVGQAARVIVAIPAGGMGQVRCRVGEELIDKIARSQDGQPIPENSVVRIEEVLGEIVIVRRT